MQIILLLGGSFNPAHDGHLYITRAAMKRLGIGQAWWLVSPGNPLKERVEMAPFDQRVKKARLVARANRRIYVSTIETKLGTRYTIDTIRALKRRYPKVRFIWLMGADNLQQFHRWKAWPQIFAEIPILVIARAPKNTAALHSKAAKRFSKYRQKNVKTLNNNKKLPKWAFLFAPVHAASATALRKKLGADAFLLHN